MDRGNAIGLSRLELGSRAAGRHDARDSRAIFGDFGTRLLIEDAATSRLVVALAVAFAAAPGCAPLPGTSAVVLADDGRLLRPGCETPAPAWFDVYDASHRRSGDLLIELHDLGDGSDPFVLELRRGRHVERIEGESAVRVLRSQVRSIRVEHDGHWIVCRITADWPRSVLVVLVDSTLRVLAGGGG